jgi:hypothetical protein
MSTQIKFRRDSSTNWAAINPILGSGEPGLETDTGKVKIGDGSSSWSSLSYVFNGYVASYSNIEVAQYLPTYTGNLRAGNVNAVTGVYSPAYYYSNGVAFVGGGTSGTTYSNSNVAAYLPTYAGNVNGTNLVGSTAVYAPAYYWANGAVFASSNYGNTQVASYLTTYQGALTANNFTGVAVYANTIGNTSSTHVGLIGTNAQPYITSVGTLSSLTATGAVQGNTHTGVAVYAGTIGNTGATLTGTLSTAAQTNITSIGTLTGLTSSGAVSITNSTNTTSAATGALVVTGGVGIGGNLYVTGNITASNINYVNTSTLSATAPIIYLTASTPFPYNYNIGMYSNMYGSASNVLAYTGFVRNHSDNVWYLFSNIGTPTSGAFNFANAALIYDTIKTGGAILANTTASTSTATGALQVSGGAGIVGAVFANSFNGVSVYAGTIGNTGSSLVGTLSTAAQTNITSVGTLSSLTATGAVQGNTHTGVAVYAGTIGNTGATLTGTLSTAAQTNITSVGTLSALGVTGTSTLGAVTASTVSAGTIGNSGTTLTGTISTAAQTNITSLGTLTSLAVGGTITATTLNAGTIGNSGAQITGGNIFANAGGVYAGSYYWANGASFSGSGTSSYSNTDVAGYLPTYTGNLKAGNLTINNNVTIAATAINSSAYGEVQSNRMMGRYSTATQNYFELNAGATIDSTDATIASRIPTRLDTNSGSEILQPAYGAGYGLKKVGLGFHVGTQNDITAASVSSATTYAGNINAVVLGYMNNGPRLSLMDYSLVDDTANVMAFTSSTYKFYGATGLTLATIDSSTKNITITGNIFGNAGTLQANTLVGSAVNAGTIGNAGATFTGASIVTSSYSQSASYTTTGGGQVYAYFTGAIGANTANTGTFTSVTTTSGGQVTGYLTGAIGANTANAGTFTTLTSSTNMISTGGFYSNGTANIATANVGTMTATTIAAGTIGNSGAVIYGTLNTASQPNITGVGTLSTLAVSGTISAAIHAGALNGAHNGTVGASTPNTGAFTTLTTTGDVTIAGNLTVNGNSTVINANNITINDTLIYMANANPANSYDIGIVGHFTAGTYQHTGVVRQASSNTWTFFSNVATEPSGNVLTFDSNTVYDTIKVGGIVWGNGASFVDSVSGYGNTQVASYLTTYRGALTANNFNSTAVYAGTIGNTGASLVGTIATAAQTNITSVGTLTSLGVGGTITATTLQAGTIGNAGASIQGATGAFTGAVTGNTFAGIAVYAGTIGNTGAALTGATLTTSGTITINSSSGVTAIANGGTNGVGNIGTSSTGFNTIFAKAASAQYADLAECYVADAAYAPGTVIDFGGDKEVTLSTTDASRRVAGVVTTNPAYLMNSHLEAEFVAAIALQGRVPTLVQGPVAKGDTMVSAGNGRARAEADPKVSTVIGKALEDFDGIEGIIEVVVGRN